MLWVCVGLALAAMLLALVFLPWRATAPGTPAAAQPDPVGAESAHDRAA
jgi:hypothetical protein